MNNKELRRRIDGMKITPSPVAPSNMIVVRVKSNREPDLIVDTLSDEYKKACRDYVRKLTAISNRCWSDYISKIDEKNDFLESYEAHQLIQRTALSGKFSDFAYTHFTLMDIMKK